MSTSMDPTHPTSGRPLESDHPETQRLDGGMQDGPDRTSRDDYDDYPRSYQGRGYGRDRYRDDDYADFDRYRERGYDDGYGRYGRGRQHQGGNDRGFADGASQFARQHLRTGETKEFFKTSEFFVTLLGVAALFISAAVQENFHAPGMWRLVTALLIAYVISRGIAKAGSDRRNRNDRDSSGR